MVLATRRPAADWATVSAERAPPEPPLAWLITILIKKYFHPYHFTKIRVVTLCNQAAFVRFVSRVLSGGVGTAFDACLQVGVGRWTGRSRASSQRAGSGRRHPHTPRRDVCGPRWWKLAASRARVDGCRSRGLGLHLPILPCSLRKFKDTCQ